MIAAKVDVLDRVTGLCVGLKEQSSKANYSFISIDIVDLCTSVIETVLVEALNFTS